MTRRVNRSRSRRDARYASAVARQVGYQADPARRHWYADPSEVLRPGDTVESVLGRADDNAGQGDS